MLKPLRWDNVVVLVHRALIYQVPCELILLPWISGIVNCSCRHLSVALWNMRPIRSADRPAISQWLYELSLLPSNRSHTNCFTPIGNGMKGTSETCIYSIRFFFRKSKHRKHPNNEIIEGRFGRVVLKATTAVSNFLTTCAVADRS
jgi:hypothetical protein